MIIVTDCDGVLLSWFHSFEWWMKRKGYKAVTISYDVSEQYAISKKHATDLVEIFWYWSHRQLYYHIPKVKKARQTTKVKIA